MKQQTFEFLTEIERNPPKKPTFVQYYLDGHVTANEIDDWVSFWHEGEDDRELMDFLGFTWDQYGKWVIDPDAVDEILESYRAN